MVSVEKATLVLIDPLDTNVEPFSRKGLGRRSP
jgi:hypothetical protein